MQFNCKYIPYITDIKATWCLSSHYYGPRTAVWLWGVIYLSGTAEHSAI